jgi:hypothetical protein
MWVNIVRYRWEKQEIIQNFSVETIRKHAIDGRWKKTCGYMK